MQYHLKIRRRSPYPKPWKWEIYAVDRLITASHESFATQQEAHDRGQAAMDEMAADRGVNEGRVKPGD